MKAIGGYFSMEINDGIEWHNDAFRLNAGRYALEYVLLARKYRKIYLPYYICETVLQPIKRLDIDYEFYPINEQLEPAIKLYPKDDEVVLYVNYFGLKNRYASTFCLAFRNTILDQTQAFYSERGNKHDDKSIQCDTIYSCRKFFGVPDGAYLYTDCILEEEIPQDESFERMTHLTKRIDRSAQDGYADFHHNDALISEAGLRSMSNLTQMMMHGIDYNGKAERRICNFQILDKALRSTNLFKWNLDKDAVPMVYPYYVEHGGELRQHLIDHQIFCARYWPNVLDWRQSSDWEYKLTENLVCLPVDQRYGEEDMHAIIDKILN